MATPNFTLTESSMRYCITLLVLIVVPGLDVLANDAALREQSEILFVRRIAPLLREKCVACHGGEPDEIEGSLDLRSLKTMMKGGDSGEPSIVPQKPDNSPL